MLAIETGWPPPELFVTVIIASGMRSDSSSSTRSRPSRSMLPLNGPGCGEVGGLGAREVERRRARELDVRARRVEVRVVGDDVAGPAHGREQDALGGAALVGGDHVLEAR